jgi:hypothetical protein
MVGPRKEKDAAVAQLVEHVIRNDGVGGSSPFSGTTLFQKFPLFPATCMALLSRAGRELIPKIGLHLFWRGSPVDRNGEIGRQICQKRAPALAGAALFLPHFEQDLLAEFGPIMSISPEKQGQDLP